MIDWIETLWLAVGWTHLAALAAVVALVVAVVGHVLPPPFLFPLIVDALDQPRWRRDLAEVWAAPGGWGEREANGRDYRYWLMESRPFRHGRIDMAADGRWRGSRSFDLEPLGDRATRLTIIEEWDLPTPWQRISARLFLDPKGRLDHYLADLTAAGRRKCSR